MTGQATRMLLLGAVALFEPVNGYQIRRELLSWQVEDWAHVNPGSIYSGLATLTRQEHLVRHDLVDGNREVAVYEMTRDRPRRARPAAGAVARDRRPVRRGRLPRGVQHAAADLRPAAIAHLEPGCAASRPPSRSSRTGLREKRGLAPPHAIRAIELQLERARVERRWLVEVLDDTRSGGLAFLGEPADWAPADDDPGWQMNTDRERVPRPSSADEFRLPEPGRNVGAGLRGSEVKT